jgi:hypothetical protein
MKKQPNRYPKFFISNIDSIFIIPKKGSNGCWANTLKELRDLNSHSSMDENWAIGPNVPENLRFQQITRKEAVAYIKAQIAAKQSSK